MSNSSFAASSNYKGPTQMSRYSKKRKFGPTPKSKYSTPLYAKAQSLLNQRTVGYIGLETKFIDYSKGATALDWRLSHANHSPTTQGCLNAIATGDGSSNRDGRKCNLQSLHINGCLLFPEVLANTSTKSQARLLIVVDTQTNKQQVTNLGEILHNSTNANEEGNHIYLFRELASTKRFKILYDKTYVLNPNSKDNAMQKNFKINIQLKGMPVNYDNGVSSNGHVNTIYDNAIYVFALSDGSNTDVMKVFLEYVSRVRFTG